MGSEAQLDRDLEVYKAWRAHELELNRATAAFEHAVLAPLYLINGGGLIAFLTLLGAASEANSKFRIKTDWAAFAAIAWALGLIFASFAARIGYKVQRGFAKAVRLRREKIEYDILPSNSLLRRKPSSLETPKQYSEEAQKQQEYYFSLTLISIMFFTFGSAFATISVLPRRW